MALGSELACDGYLSCANLHDVPECLVVQFVHQHVEVGEGGQAMVAGQVKAGVGRKQDGGGAAKMDNERHAAWREGLDRADASPHCRARRRDGAECQAPALPNGRCRMHVNGLAFRRSFSSGTAIPVWHFGRPEPKMTSA